MRHQVVDVGPALESIYQRLDAQAAQTLVTSHATHFCVLCCAAFDVPVVVVPRRATT
jgi:hypothetical protein